MTQQMIRQLAGMKEDEAISAFARIIAEPSRERVELLRVFRTSMPDLYSKWLERATGLTGRSR